MAAVPPFVDVSAGAIGQTFDITGAGPGQATITATMPASRGGGKQTVDVDVYQNAALSFDRPVVTLPLGASTTITARLDPPPVTPIVVIIKQNGPQVLILPATFTVLPAAMHLVR